MTAGHLWIEFALSDAALRNVNRLVAQNRGQRVEQLRGLDGLVEVGGEALVLGTRFAAPQRGEEYQRERSAGRLLPDRPGQGDSIHLRHVHVEDREVETLAGLDPPERLAAVIRSRAPEAPSSRGAW